MTLQNGGVKRNSKWPGIPKLLLLLRSVLSGGNEQLCVLGDPKISRSKMVPLLVCRRVSLCYESFRGIQPRPPRLWFLQARQAGVQPPGTHSVTSSSSTRKPAGLPPGNDFTAPRPGTAQLTPSSQSRGQDPALGPDAGVMHLETMDTSSLPRSPWILCLSPTQECPLRRLLSMYDSAIYLCFR